MKLKKNKKDDQSFEEQENFQLFEELGELEQKFPYKAKSHLGPFKGNKKIAYNFVDCVKKGNIEGSIHILTDQPDFKLDEYSDEEENKKAKKQWEAVINMWRINIKTVSFFNTVGKE